MVNVTTLNSVPRHEWANMSVQGADVPREKILWARPEESLLGLLEAAGGADVNQMPVVSDTENDGAHIIGMITRDSILRVMQGAVKSVRSPLRAKQRFQMIVMS